MKGQLVGTVYLGDNFLWITNQEIQDICIDNFGGLQIKTFALLESLDIWSQLSRSFFGNCGNPCKSSLIPGDVQGKPESYAVAGKPHMTGKTREGDRFSENVEAWI